MIFAFFQKKQEKKKSRIFFIKTQKTLKNLKKTNIYKKSS